MLDIEEPVALECADCGRSVEGEEERAYFFGESGVLCWGCALKRGGVYDAEQERWVERPDIKDLLQTDR